MNIEKIDEVKEKFLHYTQNLKISFGYNIIKKKGGLF